MSRRCVEVINAALHDAFERHDEVFLIGEDILDPYGGAFNASKGLSTRWPDRVLTTPISEASLVGIAAGMAIRGQRPVVEIMFGDFITLSLDQIVNGVSKFREMYDDQVSVPLVVRTPMGGRRGYGPTHSQSLEKMLVGVPNIRVVATSECHDLHALVTAAIDDDEPVFLIENKVMYGRVERRPEGGRIDGLAVREGAGPYPALTFSGNDFADAEATIVTYGGMLPVVLDAVTELIMEEEVFCEVVALSSLLPLDLDPVIESVGRTGACITAEEGTYTLGIGAEIAARVQEEAWGELRGPVRRVAAGDGIIPSAPGLEDRHLPGVADVIEAVLASHGSHAR
jgi:acetoin:2,6-dichlorophenolindophenol oxidoreductase subunit beta